MPLVRVIRNGQITLPKKLRSALRIEEGDLLEVEISNRGFYLKPKGIVDKDLAKTRFFQTVEKLRKNLEGIDAENLDTGITEAVQSVRKGSTQKQGDKLSA